MDRVTALDSVGRLSDADSAAPLASVLAILGRPRRLDAVRILMTQGPQLTRNLPVRYDELHLLEDVGVIVSELENGRELRWAIRPDALSKLRAAFR